MQTAAIPSDYDLKFPALALVIIRAAPDFKPAIQSLHWLSATENSDDFELVDMIPFKG